MIDDGPPRGTPTPPLDDNAPDAAASFITPDSEYPWWILRAPKAWQPYLLLARLDRPVGTWLLVLPCWWGSALGSFNVGAAMPDLWHFALFALGALIMRSAGCAFNDAIDKDIDAQVARTRARPVASGALSFRQAAVFTALLCLAGLVILLQFNTATIAIGIAALALVGGYPFMKRITWWPQAWLGLTFNWGVLVGYSAQTGFLDASALALYAGAACWTIGYDTIYACQDVEDDALVGVRSTARLFGDNVQLWVAVFYVLTVCLQVFALRLQENANVLVFSLLAVSSLMLVRQVWQLGHGHPDHLRLFRQSPLYGFAFLGVVISLLI